MPEEVQRQIVAAAQREVRVLARALELSGKCLLACDAVEDWDCNGEESCEMCGAAWAYAIAESGEESQTK